MFNELYLDEYLRKFTLEHNGGQVQTILEYAVSAFSLCCDVLGGSMEKDGFTVLFPLHDEVTRVVVVARDRDELLRKVEWFYNKIPSAADLHRGGTFDCPKVSYQRIGKLSERL